MEQASVDVCSNLAKAHYENFPVGSLWIPKKLQRDIHAVYAFARTADDFADESEHEGFRLERLKGWREKLNQAAKGRPEGALFGALSETIRRHDLPVQWLNDLICAFEQDVSKNRHPNFQSIVDYSRKSANPVGRMVLWIHGYRDERLFELSDRICSALQFANFWQDVELDWKKNRVYLPQDDMARFHYTEADLNGQVADKRFVELLSLQMKRTWDLFDEGRKLCDRVGRDLKMELRLVWSGGTRILEMIEENGFDVFRHRPTLKKFDQAVMLWRSIFWQRGIA